jgi:KDO2-lipid IV(A) lauroyltransferase
VKRVLATALLSASYAVLRLVAAVLRLVRWRRGLIERHVDRCLPGLPGARRRQLVTGFYRYLGEIAAEVVCERLLDRESLAARVRFENAEQVAAALGAQRRVLILSAHHSNWEWLLLRCSTGFDRPLTAVYKRLANPRFERLVRTLRERFGGRMVGTRDIVAHLMEQRGQVRLLAMLADQSPPASSSQQVWTDFFCQPTAFHSGPGWIGAKFGFQPYFAAMRRERRGHYVVRLVELLPGATRAEPAQILQAYVNALEQHVRAYPEQYFWAYNRWKRERPLYG